MDRIHHPSAAASPPPVDAHATPGYPTEGDPLGGVEATVLTAWIGHSLIEEQRNVIVAAGMTPDKATLTQLRQAIAVLLGKNTQAYGAAGTYSFTVPAGVYRIRARVWGGGGGGGGVGAGGGGAAGGAGGGYSEGWFAVTPGQVLAVTVGAGGGFGNGVPNAGSPGGTSSLGSLISATGGAGGAPASGGGIAPVTGGAGAGTGGVLNIAGSPANSGLSLGTGTLGSGGGGAYSTSLVGGVSNGAGNSAGFPGGGGGGAGGGVAENGAAGAAGLVLIDW